MEVPVSSKKLLCIYYPGAVKDQQKMLRTLGGEKNISKVYADPLKRLELKWRPQDPHCKSACGNRQSASNLLLHVRRRKKRQRDAEPEGTKTVTLTTENPGAAPSTSDAGAAGIHSKTPRTTSDVGEEYEYEASVLGIADVCYKFETMGDFQYLPMVKEKEGTSYKSIVPGIYVKNLVSRSIIHSDVPLHMPSPIFSRIDSPVDYCFKEGPKHKEVEKLHTKHPHLIGMARQRRPHFTKTFSFEDEFVPSEPYPEALEKVRIKIKDTDKLDQLKQLFAERPIWSKNALKCQMTLVSEYFKLILPSIAYFCVGGPWRSLWIRLGYDPRKEPQAKIYQMVDFRIRQRAAGEPLKMETKRGTFSYHLPNTVTNKGQRHIALINKDTFHEDYSSAEKPEADPPLRKKDSAYIFEPDVIPPYRQMFYMMTDVHVPEIQELLHSNDGKETVCTEKDGWCEPDIAEKAREILCRYVSKLVKDPTREYVVKHNIPVTGKDRMVKSKKKPKSSRLSTSEAMETDVDSPSLSTSQRSDDNGVASREETFDQNQDSLIDSDSDSDQNAEGGVAMVTQGQGQEGESDSEVDDDINEMETEILDYLDPSLAS